MASRSRLLVGAIDFGTAFSGWAFSFKHEYEQDPTKATVKVWNAGTLTTEKTPTCILLQPDGTFDSFGYDAENRYRELADKKLHTEYYFFRHFKMSLFKNLGKEIKRGMKISDEMGKQFPAKDVFAMSIKYLVDDMMLIVRQRIFGELRSHEIHWVLTVPAIWSDAAKQFMREAASKAGIENEQLTIALEPEAASIYCRHLPVDATSDESQMTISNLSTGTKYMVLDAGGGTINITVHEVQDTDTLREAKAANGGGWGGIMVDKAFEDFLGELVGENVFETFRLKETEDWLYVLRDFEAKKREIRIESARFINMRFPVSLIELCEQEKRMKFQDVIASTRYAEIVELKLDKIKMSKIIFFYMFGPSIQSTVNYVKSVFNDMSLRNVNVILMVGGYSESPLLQEAFREAFPQKRVVIPPCPSSSVLRGALIFGHNPLTVSERILRYTYGVGTSRSFIKGTHPESKRFSTDTGDRCCDLFHIFVTKHWIVKTGETQVKHCCRTVNKYQSRLDLRFYLSEETIPEYVDAEGCSKIGDLTIDFEDPIEDVGRGVAVSMAFGGTEIIVEAEDKKTGEKVRARIDFLG
ncbi:heat shock 70 kDa protein 12A-like [Mercenaria mercenaria]|uniref:heat shock 70 kDa protein 12A-like n=1 Tax=Mercenaria mercenaria TaxID=6596 RepID=UPI00234FB3CF|nr:heat shock 70 kDa protein 12A-like [Mercenaria mercenaria]